MRNLLRGFIITLILVIGLVSLTGCGTQTNNTNESGEEARKVLRVGMECAYAPYNWAQADASNGAVPISGSSEFAYGYDVMMAKFLAEKLGYELEIYQIDWDSLPVALQSNKIDCVIAGQSITA